MEKFNTTVNSWLSIIDKNQYVSTILAIVLALYAALAAPKLPPKIGELLENPLVKVLFIFMLAWTANKNPSVALVAAIGLMITLNTISRYQIDRQISDVFQRTRMEIQRQVGMRENNKQEVLITPEELNELQNKKVNPAVDCTKIGKYRNSFYPQYTNMKPDAYQARYTGNEVLGYDSSASYHTVY